MQKYKHYQKQKFIYNVVNEYSHIHCIIWNVAIL